MHTCSSYMYVQQPWKSLQFKGYLSIFYAGKNIRRSKNKKRDDDKISQKLCAYVHLISQYKKEEEKKMKRLNINVNRHLVYV